jgi:hypothetical protein
VLREASGIWRVYCDALRVCRDALREGRSIVYTKKIQRKIILDGAASKGQPLHRACAANRFVFVIRISGAHYLKFSVKPCSHALCTSVACVRLLVDAHAPIECLDSNRATPLIVAAGHSSLAVLNLLLHVCSRVLPLDLGRVTLFRCMLAPMYGLATRAGVLRSTGPQPKVPQPHVCRHPGSIHLICSLGNLPFVQVLIADSNVNARDERGCTPLHLAAAGGFNLVLAALLQAKAKVSVVDNTG